MNAGETDAADAQAAAAFEDLRAVDPGPGVTLSETVAPGRRMARNGFAYDAELWPAAGGAAATDGGPEGDGGDAEPVASGRFVVLHDPASESQWQGPWRVIAQFTAGVDAQMGRDPLLAEVTWSWLLEALAGRGATVLGERGTVTVTASRRFGTSTGGAGRHEHSAPGAGGPGPGGGTGGAGEDDDVCEVELRSSWSPSSSQALPDHLLAFCDVLRIAAGLPEAPPPPAAGRVTRDPGDGTVVPLRRR